MGPLSSTIFIFLFSYVVAEVCPDGKQSCPKSTTCCETASGSYGCCPFAAGICCLDKIHCCPSGTRCNIEEQTCDGKYMNNFRISFKWMVPLYEREKVTAGIGIDTGADEANSTALENDHEDIFGSECSNGSKCLSGQTCCLTNDEGEYGCCVYHKGTCCGDKRNCCPTNHDCDMKKGRCIPKHFSGSHKVPLPLPFFAPLQLTKATETQIKDNETTNLFCPDGSKCESRETCCLVNDDHFGCCMYPQATCCGDKKHCCPHDYTCDLEKQRCIHNVFQKKMNSKPRYTPMFNFKLNDFEVPKLITDCSTGYCQEPDSVCCSDSGFCCPSNTICSSLYKSCIMLNNSLKFVKGTSVVTRKHALRGMNPFEINSPVVCPDHKEACPEKNTCCITENDTYGCCPLPQASCCDDKLTCCPNGYVCADGGCERKPYIRFFNKPTFISRSHLRVFLRP